MWDVLLWYSPLCFIKKKVRERERDVQVPEKTRRGKRALALLELQLEVVL